MAIIKDGYMKGAKGGLGDFVVYQLGGQTVVRRKGERKKGMFSAGQRAQQVRMSAVSFLWRAMRAVEMDKSWCGMMRGRRMTGYNEFVRVNVSVFTEEGMIGDFGKLRLTNGRLLLPPELEVHLNEEGMWEMRWDCGVYYPGMSEDDRIKVVLMKREDVFTVKILDIGDCRRRHGRVRIRLPPELAEFSHLFCYVCSETGEEFSVSRHFCLTPKL
ncbi:hypothetical protein [Odoribacter lunatus]|uniref:hypothetical protein n=1 Tax=Odoribacter lunatus TaxID=2941335 RepID=UPI0020415763|nr:hypothetical protein [Odoribacter lunatus]